MGKYSDDLRAEAMALLMAGESVRAVAAQFDIPRGTIGNWSAQLNQASVPIVPDAKRHAIGDRLVLLIDKMLDTQFAMLDIMADREYLTQHELIDLSHSFNNTFDRLDRILARVPNVSGD